MRHLLLACVVAVAVAGGCARPQPPPRLETTIQAGARSSPVRGAWTDGERAHGLVKSGRLADAQALLEEGRRRLPRDPEVLAMGGDLAMARGSYPAARDLYRAALEASPRTPDLFLRLYETLLILDPSEAVTLSRDAIRWMPDSPGAWLCVAEALVFEAVAKGTKGADFSGRMAEARDAVEHCDRLGGPGTGDADAAAGEIAFLEKRWSDAEKHFQAALRKGIPNFDRATDVSSAIALIRFRANDMPGADQAFRDELALLGRDDAVDSFRFLPKWEQVQTYRHVLLGKPLTREALHAHEDVYARLRQQGVTEFPEAKHTRTLLFDLFDLRARKEYAKAAALLRDELAPEPPDKRLYAVACFYSQQVDEPLYTLMLTVLLGDVEKAAGRPAQAAQAWKQALTLAPGSTVIEQRKP